MLIWLRTPKFVDPTLTGVGIEGNVIRREDSARLISLDDGFAVLDQARLALDEERVEGQQQMQEEVQQIYARAQQEGEEQGRQLALEQWYERTLGALADYRAIQKRMRERLAELVASAVEQIVHVEDSKGLFLRALSSLDQIAEGASFLTVSVNRNDFAAAQQVFDGFALEWSRRGQPIKIVVHADKELAEGSCICESEFGIVDASLQTQIQAMRAALERALEKEISEEISEKMNGLEQNVRNTSDEFQMDGESLEMKLFDESDQEATFAAEPREEAAQENLLDEATTLQVSNDIESLAVLAPNLASEEVEVEGDLIALKKTKTATKPKSKGAAKPKVASKTAAKSKSKNNSNIDSNNEAKPSLEATEKPKSKSKRKPKSAASPQAEEAPKKVEHE